MQWPTQLYKRRKINIQTSITLYKEPHVVRLYTHRMPFKPLGYCTESIRTSEWNKTIRTNCTQTLRYTTYFSSLYAYIESAKNTVPYNKVWCSSNWYYTSNHKNMFTKSFRQVYFYFLPLRILMLKLKKRYY